MKTIKKRNYKDFQQGQLQQQTLDQFGIDTENKKYEKINKRLKLEALNDFQDCLVRLQNFQNEIDISQDQIDLNDRNHLCLAQRRKNFQRKLQQNRYFMLMVGQYPQLLEKSNKNLKYIFRQRQFLSITQKISIIELRFGSYGSLQNQQFSYSNIALRVGAKVSTVVSTVRKYRLQDAQLQIEDKRGGRPKILNQSQIMEICSVQYLLDWAHLSLDKRCDLIQEKYMIKISRFTLSTVYKENQVRYLKTHKSFHSRFSEKQLTQQRLDFISKIARFLHLGKEIIYMDETSTNVWETKSKLWQPKNTKLPMVYTLPKKRDSNVTIIGAITNKRNKIYFTISNSTNKENVLAFFSHLNKEIGLKNKVIIMDNHPAHHSKVVSNFILSKGGETLFMPPISSYFNPIETIWSWLKQKWRNELLILQGKQPSRKFMNQTLAKLCDNAPPLIVNNIANSCIGFMTKYFEEYSSKQEEDKEE